VRRLPDYWLRTAFCFDDLRLLYAPVPKAGSTALLRALAVVVGLEPERFSRSTKLEATRSLTVHDGSVWGASYRVAGKTSGELEAILDSADWLKLTAVREPSRRLWSAWVSKVLVRDPRFVAVLREDLFPDRPSSAREVLEGFRTFVLALPGSDRHDPHWLPQAGLVGADVVPYDHVGRVEELSRTAELLDAHLRTFGASLPPLSRDNPAILPFSPAVFDSPTLDACLRWTEPDRVAFGYEPPAPTSDEPEQAWFAAVEASLPALHAVIDRNERIGDLHELLEDHGDGRSRRRAIRRV
jgi:hypothetical protein